MPWTTQAASEANSSRAPALCVSCAMCLCIPIGAKQGLLDIVGALHAPFLYPHIHQLTRLHPDNGVAMRETPIQMTERFFLQLWHR